MAFSIYEILILLVLHSHVTLCLINQKEMRVKIEKITEALALGEGPHWDEQQQALFFLDIFENTIHKYVLATKKLSKTKIERSVNFIIPLEGKTDQFVVGMGLSFVIIQWDGEDDSPVKILHTLADVDEDVTPKPNINDGKADPRGRIYAGLISHMTAPGDFVAKQGSLYRVDKTGAKKMYGDITASNGLAFDQSRKAFYYVDSADLQVRRFDYDVETGELSNMKYIFHLREHGVQGNLDGMTIDSDGNLWGAVFGGSCIIKIDPVKGELLQTLDLPVNQVTSLTFGGPDFDILFVTSASINFLGPQEPPAGCTFMVTGLGVKGLPNGRYKHE